MTATKETAKKETAKKAEVKEVKKTRNESMKVPKETTTKEITKVPPTKEVPKVPKTTTQVPPKKETPIKEVPKETTKKEAKETTKEKSFEKRPSAGKQIRTLFESVIPKLKDEQLEILTSAEKTKEVLKIRYSFLKEVKNEKDERKVNGHARYGKNTIKINDKDYYITNDIYSKQVPIFEEWIKSIK